MVSEVTGEAPVKRLTAPAGERHKPNRRPRDAATLIIIDRRRGEPTILMGRRHPGLAFMPDKFVFPGGRIEPSDRKMVARGALKPRAEAALAARVSRPPSWRGRALALAAVRETFEETGILLGAKVGETAVPALDGTWAAFREHGVVPDLGMLHLVARAITPPGRPRRFDTRFFAVDQTAVASEVGGMTGPDSELIELAWVTFPKARQLDLPAITHIVLDELERRIEDGFSQDLPIPFFYERRGRRVRDLL
jgi:8-oxo-dGTP pyrophosphatase MutT (NUDIX family)